jgi:hypothetical protein
MESKEFILVPFPFCPGRYQPSGIIKLSKFGPTKKEKLTLIRNICNQALYESEFIKDIYGIIQNYIFGNGKDKKSKELFKELEDLILAESDKTAEDILRLYNEKIGQYLWHIKIYFTKRLIYW